MISQYLVFVEIFEGLVPVSIPDVLLHSGKFTRSRLPKLGQGI